MHLKVGVGGTGAHRIVIWLSLGQVLLYLFLYSRYWSVLLSNNGSEDCSKFWVENAVDYEVD